MGFLDTLGKVVNTALDWAPKIAKGVSGVANIVNAFRNGSGQREALSSFVGDTFGQKYGRMTNSLIGGATQIFNQGKNLMNQRSLGGITSGITGMMNTIGRTAGGIGSQLGGRVGAGLSNFGRGMQGVGAMTNRMTNMGSNLYGAGRNLYNSVTNKGPTFTPMSGGIRR